jgi:hypothetical protein
MINVRYHIISITAVFLALGIGLTLGSTFLDRATVENLNGRLTQLAARVQETDARNKDLDKRLRKLEERDLLLVEQLPEQTLAGHLTAVPVLVMAARGTDDTIVGHVISALTGAGASVAGTWWFTDRFKLDDDGEVRDLAAALGVTSTDPVRLRRLATQRIAELLTSAGSPAAIPDSAGAVAAPPAEPELIGVLRSKGFVEYDVPSGSPSDKVLLASAGTRFVVVGGGKPDLPDTDFMIPLMSATASDGPTQLVAVQGASDPTATDEERISFVGPLRADDVLSTRLSTVDDMESAAGLVALVLATEDLADLKVGHYGISSTASRLLPAPEPGG